MKKVLFTAIIATSLFACGTKSEKTEATASASYPADATGYSIDSSANITALKKLNATEIDNYVDAAKAAYADTVTLFDNNRKQTLAESLANIPLLKSKGIKVHTDKYDAIWESVNNKVDDNGVKNYVFAYQHVSFTKGDKKVTVVLFQVDAFRADGKIVKEWNVYDTYELASLFK